MKYLSALLLFVVFLSSGTSTIAQCESDSIAPTSLAVNLSTAIISAGVNSVDLYAIDFFFYAVDDCTSTDSLRYTFGEHPDIAINYDANLQTSYMVYDCKAVLYSPIEIDVAVWDLAGNKSEHTVSTTFVAQEGLDCTECVNDTVPPVVVTETWTALLDDEGLLEIWASDFALGTTDNCTPMNNLEFSFTPVPLSEDSTGGVMFFDCEAVLNSPVDVPVYVWDEAGNYSMGIGQLIVQSNTVDCDTTVNGTSTITSNLRVHIGEPMVGVTVVVEDEDGDEVYNTTTNAAGDFTIPEYTIERYLRLSFDDPQDVETTVLDMVTLQQHLLGLTSLTIPQLYASDLDGDGKVRINDLRMVRDVILGDILLEDHVDTRWSFLDKNSYDLGGAPRQDGRILLNVGEVPIIFGYRVGDIR